MQVLFLNPLEERLRDFPARYLPTPEFEVFLPAPDGSLPEALDNVEACVYWDHPVGKATLDQLPALRFIQRVGQFRATGDLSPAFERGIIVAVTPYGVLARVAQHTLMLMLALARNLLASHQAVLDRTNKLGMAPEYAGAKPVAFNWAGVPDIGTLYGKTLGIIGFGEAGSVLAKLVRPFDMDVLYYKRRRLTPGQEYYYGVQYAPLDELLERSDFVTTFVPYRDENRGLIGEREIRLMKRGAFFVNTGRANVTDEAALIRALQDGYLAGAGLDVFSHEPLPDQSPLRDLPNVILTPHVAGGIGGWQDTFERIATNLRLVRDGRLPVGQISRDDFVV
jgi:phosphoglycerate dehydrogenase-like enzyme